jgi:hypothetical protein
MDRISSMSKPDLVFKGEVRSEDPTNGDPAGLTEETDRECTSNPVLLRAWLGVCVIYERGEYVGIIG